MSHYATLFGPVPSRRFGRSLGIDLTPLKTCSLDCVFCQLGRTTVHTVDRRPYVDLGLVIQELRDWFDRDGQADVLTLSGSGEPTLHSGFGDVLEAIAETSGLPSLLLTNGTLLNRKEVRQSASKANMVKSSLCAWDEASFQAINRPHPRVHFQDFVQGQVDFRKVYSGQLFLEVFLLQSMNDAPEQIQAIAEIAGAIEPDRIQLNTVDRPPAETFARPVPLEQLRVARETFGPKAEIIARQPVSPGARASLTREAIVNMLRRRPATMEQLCNLTGRHRNEIAKIMAQLHEEGTVTWRTTHGEQFYLVPEFKA